MIKVYVGSTSGSKIASITAISAAYDYMFNFLLALFIERTPRNIVYFLVGVYRYPIPEMITYFEVAKSIHLTPLLFDSSCVLHLPTAEEK